MREIKFRAWSKNLKEMCHVITINLLYSHLHYVLGNSELEKGNYPGDVELMQFTGLHDKNGKEIYEGDICYYWPDANRQTFQVAYIGSCFRGINKDVIYGRIEDYAAAGLKIIGNIYENSELLEDADA